MSGCDGCGAYRGLVGTRERWTAAVMSRLATSLRSAGTAPTPRDDHSRTIVDRRSAASSVAALIRSPTAARSLATSTARTTRRRSILFMISSADTPGDLSRGHIFEREGCVADVTLRRKTASRRLWARFPVAG